MAQHFLPSIAARTLSLSKVMRLSNDQAFETFRSIRWARPSRLLIEAARDKCREPSKRRDIDPRVGA